MKNVSTIRVVVDLIEADMGQNRPRRRAQVVFTTYRGSKARHSQLFRTLDRRAHALGWEVEQLCTSETPELLPAGLEQLPTIAKNIAIATETREVLP